MLFEFTGEKCLTAITAIRCDLIKRHGFGFQKLGLAGWKEALFSDSKFYPPKKNDIRVDLMPSNWQWAYVTGKLLWDPSLDENKLLAKALNVNAPNLEYVSQEELVKRYPKLSLYGLRFVCQHMCSDITKAERELGWKPGIPLEAGLRENVEWMFEKGFLNRQNEQ